MSSVPLLTAGGDLETGQGGGPLELATLGTPPPVNNKAPLNRSDGENGLNKREPALTLGWDDISLDSQSDIVVWEFQSKPSPNDPKWADRVFNAGSENLELGDKIAIRLFLVEGVTEETMNHITKIPGMGVGKEFFYYHCLNDLASDLPELQEYFFAKWPRRFSQNPRQWKIEAKLAMNRPWDLENIVDPAELSQDHDRYSKVQRVYRPHAPLELIPAESNGPPAPVNPKAKRKKRKVKKEVVEKDRFLAAGECVSCYFQKVKGGFIGIVIFDKPPEFEIEDRKYEFGTLQDPVSKPRMPRFENFKKILTSFHEALKTRLSTNEATSAFAKNPIDLTRSILLQFILDDHREILLKLRGILDYVDDNMSDDNILHKQLPDWRVFFGLWRKMFWHDLSAVSYTKDMLDPALTATTQLKETFFPKFKELVSEMEFVKRRLDSTFQAIMSTMAIVESQKAIAQAETISKLTNLAFFFIPLTLTAGVFGMNIVEWQNRLKLWEWIVVSLAITILTYISLYFGEIIAAISQGSSYLQNLDPASGRRVAYYRLRRFGRSIEQHRSAFFKTVVYLCILGAAVAGVWALATKTHLSKHEKASVGFGFAVALPVLLILWSTIIWDTGINHVKKGLLLLSFVVFLGIVALIIWGIFRNPHYSHSKKVSLSVFVAVFLPCLFSIVVVAQASSDSDNEETAYGFVFFVLLLVAVAAIIWAIVTKSPISKSAKIGVSLFITVILPLMLVCCAGMAD